MNSENKNSFSHQIGPIFFLTGIFLLNFLGRIVLSPLLPTIENDLKIGHDEAGFLFFIVALGYCVSLLGSGFISHWLNHRRTIVLSSVSVGIALLIIGFSRHLWEIRMGLIFLGLAAGIYLPSAIATISELVEAKDLGKAFAIHELAPNIGFVIAPILAETILRRFSWQGVLIILGMVAVIFGVLFYFFGKGGTFRGETPKVNILKMFIWDPSFWIMAFLFTLGIGASFAVYSMLPLYLVKEKAMDRTLANTLLGLSRILTSAMAFLSGWLTDRFGIKRTLKIIFLTTGLTTAMLGFIPTPWVILIVFLQPLLAACFFPPGFVALSRMSSPEIKNVAVSLTMPFSFLLGGGVIPAGMGTIGEISSFSIGFILLGGIILGGAILTRYLKL